MRDTDESTTRMTVKDRCVRKVVARSNSFDKLFNETNINGLQDLLQAAAPVWTAGRLRAPLPI
jgi:hypothetical protein